MILAQAAEQAAAIDPTLLTFLIIFGAVGVTTLAGVGLAFWQSHRDHARWVRERRYEGFTRILALAERSARILEEGMEMMERSEAVRAAHEAGDKNAGPEAGDLAEEMERNLERVRPIQAELSDVAATLEVLGPDRVIEALNALSDSYRKGDAQATEEAKDAFVIAVRKALKITA
ncbi:hypothetical protein [Microbacterium aurantiacum]|uniref:Secreted protein n=1 Tax=Microbacterium aurantiacum TaxID=162393 RepID=A0ABT8FU74_9MICO|nr:hypothetical protein [Microbacterium aurantiacum]MDN4464721.1 hypothetical protein [Microbacterium aurantiacum]